MKKIGLVLEGGSMRGLFTTGVLDTFLENNIEVDGIVSVSAGALFGVNYVSKQKGRGLRYNKKYIGDKRYISIHSLISTGNLVNKDFTFYKIAKELDPLDNETFKKSNKDFYVTTTNIETGTPEYIKIIDPIEQLEAFRATSAIPLMSEIIEINNQKYLDGGISDSIPLDKCIALGYEKIIVILTQPLGFEKTPLSTKKIKMLELKYHQYPEFIKANKERYMKYNKTLEKIIDLENKKEIFVIRPSKKIKVNLLVNKPDEIQEVYDMGVNDCKKILPELIEYLKWQIWQYSVIFHIIIKSILNECPNNLIL